MADAADRHRRGASKITAAAVLALSGAPAGPAMAATPSGPSAAADVRTAWIGQAVAALSREDCGAALAAARGRLSADPQDFEANRVVATAVDCENTLHARARIRSRIHLRKYRPVDLDAWKEALAASARYDPSPDYRALAVCKLDMLSLRPDAALSHCAQSYAVGRQGRFAFQAAFSLGQARLDAGQLDASKASFLEAAGIAQRAGDRRDRQSAVEHANLVSARIANIPTVADLIYDEAVQEEMMRDLVLKQNEEAFERR